MRIGIVGAGQIAGAYAKDLTSYPELDLVGVTDVVGSRAEELAGAFGVRPYADLAELLDGEVDMIVNATGFAAHASVTRQGLLAGKHVYTEKPLASTPEDADELVRLARERGLRLACAPCNHLGEAQQTTWHHLSKGSIGPVRTVYAEAHGGRIESWHPAPESFFAAGPMADLAVYPLTLLTTFLGPVRTVAAQGRVLRAQRRGRDGSAFSVTSPDFVVAMLTLAGGALVRLTTSFDLPRRGPNSAGLEFHGDDGYLRLDDWQLFPAKVALAPPEGPFTTVPLLRAPQHEVENGRGVREVADAIAAGRPHRGSAEQGAHLVDALAAAARSLETGRSVEVTSGFPPPEPMSWARA